MYKSILFLTSLLFIQYSFSQTNRFQVLLYSGKAAFKEQAAAQTSDYTYPFEILQQAVALQPDNAEARYFLGYTIDRLNANDGSTMYLVKKDFTLKASEQF